MLANVPSLVLIEHKKQLDHLTEADLDPVVLFLTLTLVFLLTCTLQCFY